MTTFFTIMTRLENGIHSFQTMDTRLRGYDYGSCSVSRLKNKRFVLQVFMSKVFPDHEYMLKLAEAKMPFGKYAGTRLVDLPEAYIVWFSNKGFPEGELGDMLRSVYEIKLNGLEYLFRPLRK